MSLSPKLLAACLLCICGQLSAGVKITGSIRYQFGGQNATVSFGCDGIANNSKENATGTLMVKLWALDAPHRGGGISGVGLGSYKLEGLNPGRAYTKLSKTVTSSLPQRKKAYYLCLTVLEFKGGGYVISDYRNFDGSVVLGPLPLFTMTGPWRWQTSTEGGTVDVEVAKISHNRPNGTGTLRLEVWATSKPYTGGGISGFQLGVVKKDPLRTGYSYTNLKNTAKYNKPPPGRYYVSILLSEFSDGEFRAMAHLGSSTAVEFR